MGFSFSVREISDWAQGRLANAEALGGAASSIQVRAFSPLKGSGAADVAFFFSAAYKGELPAAAPGILVTGEDFVKPLEAAGLPLWKKTAVIACKDPYLAMARISGHFADRLSSTAHVADASASETEVHTTAVVHPGAKLGRGVKVGAHCVLEEGTVVGDGTVLYPSCTIGPRVVIGRNCVFFPRVTVYEWAEIGDRVRIHAGAVIGADGFGYAPVIENGRPLRHEKIHHLGRVIIGDDVEIGANTCVDRGTLDHTRIERGAKLDNLVQVGHNVHIEEGAVICGDTALAGSSRVGKFAYVGGVTGVCNQVHIGDGAKVAAMTLVSKDVPPGGTAVGNPQREHREFFRVHAILSKMLRDRKKGSRKNADE